MSILNMNPLYLIQGVSGVESNTSSRYTQNERILHNVNIINATRHLTRLIPKMPVKLDEDVYDQFINDNVTYEGEPLYEAQWRQYMEINKKILFSQQFGVNTTHNIYVQNLFFEDLILVALQPDLDSKTTRKFLLLSSIMHEIAMVDDELRYMIDSIFPENIVNNWGYILTFKEREGINYDRVTKWLNSYIAMSTLLTTRGRILTTRIVNFLLINGYVDVLLEISELLSKIRRNDVDLWYQTAVSLCVDNNTPDKGEDADYRLNIMKSVMYKTFSGMKEYMDRDSPQRLMRLTDDISILICNSMDDFYKQFYIKNDVTITDYLYMFTKLT